MTRVRVEAFLRDCRVLHSNLPRPQLIREVLARGDALASPGGALAYWSAPESTGRSPQDTYMVRHGRSETEVDWSSSNCNPMTPALFDTLLDEALGLLGSSKAVYHSRRSLGAVARWAMDINTVSDRPLPVLFADNMFRPPMTEAGPNAEAFHLLVLPQHKLDPKKYEGLLRRDPKTGRASTMAIAMDFERRLGLVIGSAYCGTVKKLGFTVMNALLPRLGVLPLHCAANEGAKGDCALFLGLSGTGKTTLSAAPGRLLLGDDEHGWDDQGIANMEHGCYAKLIDLNPLREPEINQACFHEAPSEQHGAIIENAMYYPDGRFDLADRRLTENSRGSYPLAFLDSIKEPPVGGHPKAIVFLTADANGVLPPVAVLPPDAAMFWFMMGYTSKLAGTETGVVEPQTTFSRFFGAPFMPGLPSVYAALLGEKLRRHGSRVYLVNTGWTAGPYGQGRRMDLRLTRTIVQAALDGTFETVPLRQDPTFKLAVPTSCPGLEDASVLDPESTWTDRAAFRERAGRLAAQFAAHYQKAFPNRDRNLDQFCPGL